MTLQGAKTKFLGTILIRKNQKYVMLTIVCTLQVHSHAYLNENSVNVISCLILHTINYRGNRCSGPPQVSWWDHYEFDNLFCILHSSSSRARPNRFISFVIIASRHWTQPEPKTPSGFPKHGTFDSLLKHRRCHNYVMSGLFTSFRLAPVHLAFCKINAIFTKNFCYLS